MKPTNAFRPARAVKMPRPHLSPTPPSQDLDQVLADDRVNLIEALRDDESDFGRSLLRELEGER